MRAQQCYQRVMQDEINNRQQGKLTADCQLPCDICQAQQLTQQLTCLFTRMAQRISTNQKEKLQTFTQSYSPPSHDRAGLGRINLRGGGEEVSVRGLRPMIQRNRVSRFILSLPVDIYFLV